MTEPKLIKTEGQFQTYSYRGFTVEVWFSAGSFRCFAWEGKKGRRYWNKKSTQWRMPHSLEVLSAADGLATARYLIDARIVESVVS